MEWMRVVADVGVGGAVGAVDQLVQNQDDKRKLEKPDLGIMSRYGTYYNYGFPIAAIFLTAFGVLKDHWATRVVTAGSQLAGRKVVKQVTKVEGVVPWTKWNRDKAAEANARMQAEARAREAAARTAREQVGGPLSPIGIPVIADEAILV